MEEQQEKRKRGRPKGSGHKNKGYTVSDKVLARRERTTLKKRMETATHTDEEKEFNARLITHVMRVQEIASHADRSDVNTLRSCFCMYVQLCQEDGFKVSNIAACASMGFPTTRHFDMFCQKDDPERKALQILVKSTCSMFREMLVGENKLNPVIGIFWQRNFDGLRNDTEQVQSALEQDENYANGSKAYKEKYRNLIGE